MKKVLSLVLAATLAVSLSACGGALVDLDTPKSEELTAQYDFYPDAMNTIRADMKITPEQADEVFIILTSCGLDGKITSISESNGAYTVYYGGSSLDVALSDGAVEAVYSGRDMLYPEYHKHNVLMDYDLTVKDVKTGSGDKIGEYAYAGAPSVAAPTLNAGDGRTSVVIHSAPVFHVGNDAQAQDIEEMLRRHDEELLDEIDERERQRQDDERRRNYD